jgi:DNA repair protein RecO
MPIDRVSALTLGTAPLAEQDREVFLLTERGELRRAIAPGALKSKNRFGSLLELFSFSEFVYYWREDRPSWTLSKGDLLISRVSIFSKPDNLFHGVFMAEALWQFHARSQEHPRLYRLVSTLLQTLDQGLSPREILPYFLVWLLRMEGLLFSVERCSSCSQALGPGGAWLRDDGRGLLCPACRRQEKDHFSPHWLDYISWTRHHSISVDEARALELSGREGYGDLVRALKKVIEIHGEFRFKTPLL